MVNRHRKGLTLVEMLVAFSLCVIMIGAITGVLSSLMQQQRQRLVLRSDVWQANFHRLLWTDLSQSRLVARLDSGIALALSDGSLVVYQTRESDVSQRTLIRGTLGHRDPIALGSIPSLIPASDSLDYRTVTWSIESIEFFRGDSVGSLQPIPFNWSPAPSALCYRMKRTGSRVPPDQWIVVR